MSFDYIDEAAAALHQTNYPYIILLGSSTAGQVMYSIDSRDDIDNRHALVEAMRQFADALEAGDIDDMNDGTTDTFREDDDEDWRNAF